MQSVNFKADQKLLDFVEERLGKLSQVYDSIIGADVYLKLDNNGVRENKIVEIKLNIPGNDLMVSKECKSFEEAADLGTDVLRRQLKKHKEKERKVSI